MPVGVRLLPNAVTVVALCSGLSAVYFALSGRFALCVAATGIAALCDAVGSTVRTTSRSACP